MTPHVVELVVSPDGTGRCLYDESVDLTLFGELQIQRASHCEPDAVGAWWADLSPVSGPKLGPFDRRSVALAAEVQWLRRHVLHTEKL